MNHHWPKKDEIEVVEYKVVRNKKFIHGFITKLPERTVTSENDNDREEYVESTKN